MLRIWEHIQDPFRDLFHCPVFHMQSGLFVFSIIYKYIDHTHFYFYHFHLFLIVNNNSGVCVLCCFCLTAYIFVVDFFIDFCICTKNIYTIFVYVAICYIYLKHSYLECMIGSKMMTDLLLFLGCRFSFCSVSCLFVKLKRLFMYL